MGFLGDLGKAFVTGALEGLNDSLQKCAEKPLASAMGMKSAKK